MGLSARQKRFAHEFSVDHNGAQAAIRAGYSVNRAKQTGSRLMANVAVRQLVVRLDERKQLALGVEGVDAVEEVRSLLAEARVLQPKIWKGQVVTYVPGVWRGGGCYGVSGGGAGWPAG